MDGKEFKLKLSGILRVKGITLAELARNLGMKAQTLNSRFLVKDITSGLIEDVCRELNVDISEFYPGCHQSVSITNDNRRTIARGDHSIAASDGATVTTTDHAELIAICKQLLADPSVDKNKVLDVISRLIV